MFLFSVFIPLCSYLICMLLNKNLKDEYVCVLSCILLVLSSIFSLVSLLSIDENQDQALVLTSWINSGSLSIDWSIQYNLLSSSMVLMVNFVSCLIHIYSVGYMSKDHRKVILWVI